MNGWFCLECLILVFSINHIQYGLINLIGGQLLLPFTPVPDLGRLVAEWELVWKGMKGSLVVRAAALYPFPAWQRLPALCPPSQKPPHQPEMDRERAETERENGPGLVWSLGYWDSWAFSWTVTHLCVFVCVSVCVSVCKGGYLIAPVLVVRWVCNMILQVCYLSVWVYVYMCVWEEEAQEAAVFMYTCVRNRASGLSLLVAGMNKQELICNILTWQLNKRRNKARVGLDDSQSHTLPMCCLNQMCPWGSRTAYSSMTALIISKTCLVCESTFIWKVKAWVPSDDVWKASWTQTAFVLSESLFSSSCLPS